MKAKYLIIAIFGMIVVSGCGNKDIPPLTETHVITGFNFSIDFPEGWFSSTEDTVTWISETRRDFDRRHEPNHKLEGIGIVLQHEPLSFLEELGLPSDAPTLDDLFALNIGALTGMTNPIVTESTIFGVPALRSEYYEEDHWDISYAGYINNEAFFFLVSAPSEEMLENFKPTFDLMIASITPID